MRANVGKSRRAFCPSGDSWSHAFAGLRGPSSWARVYTPRDLSLAEALARELQDLGVFVGLCSCTGQRHIPPGCLLPVAGRVRPVLLKSKLEGQPCGLRRYASLVVSHYLVAGGEAKSCGDGEHHNAQQDAQNRIALQPGAQDKSCGSKNDSSQLKNWKRTREKAHDEVTDAPTLDMALIFDDEPDANRRYGKSHRDRSANSQHVSDPLASAAFAQALLFSHLPLYHRQMVRWS